MSNASNSDRPEGCLSPKEFARRAGVSKSTVDRYLKKGLLTKVQRRKGYRVWIPEHELYSTIPCPEARHSSESGEPQRDAIQEGKANPMPGKVPAWMNGLQHTNKGGSNAQK
tara:strand:+ start:6718 stop:7053 length:336 start_codon:yes stop_codon:yes gene_type:complete